MQRSVVRGFRASSHLGKRLKKKDYVFPQLKDEDIQMECGTNVSKMKNAVRLIHKPSGITVKVHETRQLSSNQKIAREYMVLALDRHLNGDRCWEAQKENEVKTRQGKEDSKAAKQREIKTRLKDYHETPDS